MAVGARIASGRAVPFDLAEKRLPLQNANSLAAVLLLADIVIFHLHNIKEVIALGL